MNMIQKAVTDALDSLDIDYEITEHPPVYTIDEMKNLGITHKGDVVKNLFLRDAKGKRHFLVVLDKDKRADLKAIQEQLSCSKLSFASEERLKKHLGLSRGSVTPLGILNDAQGMVELVFDRDLIGRRRLGVHPNENTATIWISFDNLKKISQAFHHPIQYVSL